MKNQPWIFSAKFDLSFILAPAFLISAAVLLLANQLENLREVSPLMWLVLIVGVDVGHVYSTIFRTYLDRNELEKRQALYVLVPLFAWIIGCFLYSIDALWFWRFLTYFAVFHFVRQQYGFMMIYSRQKIGTFSKFDVLIDKLAIYLATIYPLVFWHCHQRNFDWFVADDFVKIDAPIISEICGIFYLATLLIYCVKELILCYRHSSFNWPKNLLLIGTALLWFVGIVFFDNDIAFSATNVIAHGIPYLALIWIFGRNQTLIQKSKTTYIWPIITKIFAPRAVILYVVILLFLAFFEEWLWDGFIWREHSSVMVFSDILPQVSDTTLVWLVPILTLPQLTHYILDAFIWRLKTSGTNWKETLFYQVNHERN